MRFLNVRVDRQVLSRWLALDVYLKTKECYSFGRIVVTLPTTRSPNDRADDLTSLDGISDRKGLGGIVTFGWML